MIWLVMIATGLFTFATRFIMLSNIIGNRPIPWIVDALGFVPIAVLTAIIAPAILLDPANPLPLEVLRREIHRLSGSAAMFGAKAFTQNLREIETLCKSGAAPEAMQQLQGLPPLWAQTLAALHQHAHSPAVQL